MSTPSRSRSRLVAVELPRELKPVEKVKLWIERVDDFEPPIQDQAQLTRPATPVAQGALPSTLAIGSIAQHETQSVILSRSRYSQSLERAESEPDHDQDKDNKSVVTLSRSYVPSTPPKTPKRATPPQEKSRQPRSKPPVSPTKGSKKTKSRNHGKTPKRQVKQEPVSNDESPLAAPRNIIPSPQSRGSYSPSFSRPPSPSVPRKGDRYRPVSPLARAPSSHRQSIRHYDPATETPSIPPDVEFANEDVDFEDELEVLREQEQQEERQRNRETQFRIPCDPPGDNIEAIEAELASILIHEQEDQEQDQGKIVLEERTDEEYRHLREQQLKLTQFLPSSPQPPGSFTSLFNIWSRALEAHHLTTVAQSAKSVSGKDKTPHKKHPKIPPFIPPASANDLLSRLENLSAHGITLSPVFPPKGPPCQLCDKPSTFGRVSAQNPNGNAHRPYYKCLECDKWTTWGDLRGVRGWGENPECQCDDLQDASVISGMGIGKLPSRMNVTGKRALKGPGKIFFTCAEGRCGFFEWAA